MKGTIASFFTLGIILIMMSCDDNTNNPVQPHYADCADASEQWKIISTAHPSKFYPWDIFFPSAEVGYAVSNGGTIMKTVDAGNTWTILNNLDFPHPVTESILTTVFFINNDIGFIGSRGTDYKDHQEGSQFLTTTDGGMTWSKKFATQVNGFYDLLFWDQQEGLALVDDTGSYHVHLMHTVNDGDNWTEITVPGKTIESYEFTSFGSALFLLIDDDQHMSKLAISHDYGVTWELKELPSWQIPGMVFINEQVGFVSYSKVYKTIDGGNTWTYTPESPLINPDIVHFYSDQQGIVIKQVYDYYSSGGELHDYRIAYSVSETKDGGITWTETLVNPDCDLTGAYFSYSPEVFYTMYSQCNRFELK